MPPATRWSRGPGRPTAGGGNYVYNVWATRYLPGIGWGNAEPLDSNNMQQPNLAPHVAVGANQNAIVVWHRRDSGIDHVKSSHYSAGGGLGRSRSRVDPAVVSRNARVAIDSAGNALAVWEQYVGATANVMASRYNGGTWDGPDADRDRQRRLGAHAADRDRCERHRHGVLVAAQCGRVHGQRLGESLHARRRLGKCRDDRRPDSSPPRSRRSASTRAARLVVVWQQMVGSLSHLWASGYR